MAGPPATASVVLLLADEPAIRFVSPPSSVVAWLRHRYGALLAEDRPAPVDVRFEPLALPEGTTRLGIDAMVIGATPDGRYLLVDEAGRSGQLPRTGEERLLVCDPGLDPQLWGPLDTWLERVLDWQAARRGMATLKGGALTLPEGTVAIAAFQGSGKSSTILSLLGEASAYLCEDRLTVYRDEEAGRPAVAAFPVPIRLSRGRHYQIDPDVLRRSLSTADRRLLEVAPHLPVPVQRWLRERWIPLDLARAFPSLRFPGHAPLDAMVFLQPRHGGAPETERLGPQTAVTLAAALASFHHDRYIAPFEQMHTAAFPDEVPWTVAPREAKLELLGPILHDLPSYLVRVPIGGDFTGTGRAVRDALRAAVDERTG